ncbi:pyridoxal-phosphate dependent enzyme [Actinocrinis puniceicyclus]|uniref:threonine ammonia-lyase n=1 Tax=Actinocrinis puniceicyclus TaxID=977794 RepID=A0A8J7WKC1_9ACTN|nr:pyridoxal-phosphate dependent enzyme [Actinocrinis puniceicyclus]MBS2961409.1 pyridoxal-phosphate dependent enzyme [Actinocrinis puniceicyclus]
MTTSHSAALPDEPTFTDVLEARRVLAAHLPPTPAWTYPVLNEAVGATVWIKHENAQPVGAFKVRGGLTLLASLSPGQRAGGVVAASTGNHAQSVAYAARQFGAPCTIVMPQSANPVKAAAVRALGAELVLRGEHFDECRRIAAQLAAESGARYVDSGNEAKLIAGVATAALEMFEVAPRLDALFVPVGSGTGAAGACLSARAVAPDCRVIGVQSAQAPAAYESWRGGSPVQRPNKTVIEGLSTGEAFHLPQRIMRALLADFLLLDDTEIRAAQRLMLVAAHTMAEGAGAAALAGLLARREQYAGRNVGLICSGGNVSEAELSAVLGTPLPA